MVFSHRAAAVVRELPRHRPAHVAPWSSGDATDSNDQIVVSLNWEEIRRFMWSYVGIVRSVKRLERARRRIEILRDEIREYYIDFKITSDLIELRNLALVAHPSSRARRRKGRAACIHARLSRDSRSTPLRDPADQRSAQLAPTILFCAACAAARLGRNVCGFTPGQSTRSHGPANGTWLRILASLESAPSAARLPGICLAIQADINSSLPDLDGRPRS
jgi:hypothetical protein